MNATIKRDYQLPFRCLPYVRLCWGKAVICSKTGGPGPIILKVAAIGIVKVENSAYNKKVIVHSQIDFKWIAKEAIYYGPANDGFEFWKFTTDTISYPPYFGANGIDFALELCVDGKSSWDNNNQRNYKVEGPGAGMPKPNVALGLDNLKVADFNLVINTDSEQEDGSVFFVDVTLRNIAYQKNVSIVYSVDGWRSVQVVNATYYNTFGSPELESWSAKQILPVGIKKVDFAVAYAVDGATYWDNNCCANYSAEIASQ